MPRLVAFLRAINVGGHVVKMDALRAQFESLGFANVETFIASGNVIFDGGAKSPARLEPLIEKQLEKALGYEVATFLRTEAEVAAIAHYRAFPPAALAKAGAFCVGFLRAPLARAVADRVAEFRTDIDDFHLHGRELYWLCLKGQSQSKFNNVRFEKRLGVQSTFRGLNTVVRLSEALGKKAG